MYKVAIVGYRVQGKLHHAPAFAKHPDCKIVAVCDVLEERAREGADTYRVPFYLDVDAMLDKEEIDIVAIPVGEKYRFDLVMKCLQRNKHVFTEKPLVAEAGQYRIVPGDVPKARAMIDEWRKHNVAFGICFGLHGGRNVRWAKQVIRSGEYGPLAVLQARCAIGSWNHIIDMFRFLGGEVAEVFAYADEGWRSKTAAVKFESGAVGTLMMSADLALQYQFKWIGRKGEVQIDDIGGTAWARSNRSYEYRYLNEQGSLASTTYFALFDDHIAEFVDCIKEGRPFDADGWAGLRHMEIDAAIGGSIMTGQPVKVERYLPEYGRTIFSE
ncbi:MAG: Gfo/Idh/MocA family oxidoreductase [Armatimonadetes bacterium]|nr:Gfo/Idh/MocA family oxidoreductase [Armatimonadota bacterium]